MTPIMFIDYESLEGSVMSNLKPIDFDKSIRTVCGRNARIASIDRKDPEGYSAVVLIEWPDSSHEIVVYSNAYGQCKTVIGGGCRFTLENIPQKVTKYINIYKRLGVIGNEFSTGGSTLYDTPSEAMLKADLDAVAIAIPVIFEI